MIIVEEQHDQESKWHSHKYPLHVERPKVDQPASRLRWVESSADGQNADVGSLDCTRNVSKADPENGCNLCNSLVFMLALGKTLPSIPDRHNQQAVLSPMVSPTPHYRSSLRRIRFRNRGLR